MKIAFKVMSILLLVYYGIIAIIGILGIAGVGAATAGKTGGEAAFGGVAILAILLPTAIALFMAFYGVKENYNMCFKLAAILMVLNIISFIGSDNKSSAVLGLVFSIAYCFMAKKLDDGAY